MRGLRLTRMVSPEDWLHYLLAALTHDIGYIRGLCPGDTTDSFVIDAHGNRVTPPRGASDAFLTRLTSNVPRLWCATGSAQCPRSTRNGLRGPLK